MTKRYLRLASVAGRYDYDKRSIERLVKAGKLPPPHHYMGNAPLWDEDALDAHDAAQAAETAAA
jgi:hypothetical protein